MTAILDDDHGLVVLNPDVDPVGHDADLIVLDVVLCLSDVYDVLFCLLLSADVVELVEH